MTNTIEFESERSEGNIAPWTAWRIVSTILNIVNHLLIVIVAIYITFLTFKSIITKGSSMKFWHIFLCTIGYQLLMTQSIMAFYSENLWSNRFNRQTQRTLHWVLQTIGSTTAIIGMLLEYVSREQRHKIHFKGAHGIVGLIAGILTLFSMLNGVSALWSIYFRNFIKPVYLKLAHNLIGTTAFVFGLAALFLGYDIDYMIRESTDDIRMWLKVFCVITTILTLFGAVRTAFRHFRHAFP